jgi:carbamoyl-phosphate synthase small subunit
MTDIFPTALIILNDGTIIEGHGCGAETAHVGEICFNTGMTGYQETLTDPSYASQIITFTSPHIGNVGCNVDDLEKQTPYALGVIMREKPTTPSNYRSEISFDDWLKDKNLPGIYGVNTRALTKHIRDHGAPNGVLAVNYKGEFDRDALLDMARGWNGLEGADLAKEVTCDAPYEWNDNVHPLIASNANESDYNIVAVDFGAKDNILRCLKSTGAKVTVVPANTPADDIMSMNPDGVFLSNGPGDPAATGVYAVPMIKSLLDQNMPIFGICLGHQLLALALGGQTEKMHLGHRGANHPVQDLQTGKVEITSQNHGFKVLPDTLPDSVEITHKSLFDQSNEGLRVKDGFAFSVQYHPEASPGPTDSRYLFDRFIDMINESKKTTKAA